LIKIRLATFLILFLLNRKKQMAETILTIDSKTKTGQLVHDVVTLLHGWDGRFPLRFTIKEMRKKRTLDQNSLYWKWVHIIADCIGDDNESVHYDLACKFLPCTFSKIGRQLVPQSTTKLDTKEMSAYMEKVRALASSMGIELPSPEDLIDYSVYER
jgi:hypothetical protein